MDTLFGCESNEIPPIISVQYIRQHHHKPVPGDYIKVIYKAARPDENQFVFFNDTVLDSFPVFVDMDDYQQFCGKSQPDKREAVWVKLTEFCPSEQFAFCGTISRDSKEEILRHFYQTYQEGEFLFEPVFANTRSRNIEVQLGPDVTYQLCTDRLLFRTIVRDGQYKLGHVFYIDRISPDHGSVSISYVPFSRFYFAGERRSQIKWNTLPAHISSAYSRWDDVTVRHSDSYPYIREQVLRIMTPDMYLSEGSLFLEFCRIKYNEAYQAKRVLLKQGTKNTKGSFELGIQNENGVPLSCRFVIKGRNLRFTTFGCASANTRFLMDVLVPNWGRLFDDLYDTAHVAFIPWKKAYNAKEKELIANTIKMAYYKAVLDGLVYVKNHSAVFGTGYVNSKGSPIYCCLNFVENNTEDFYHRHFVYSFMAAKETENKWKTITETFDQLPAQPSFLGEREEEESFPYDPGKEIHYDIFELILKSLQHLDNVLVRNIINKSYEATDALTMLYRKPLAEISATDVLGGIRKRIPGWESVYKVLSEEFSRQIQDGMERVKKNPQTALPYYIPLKNRIGFLIPLYGSNTEASDLVLVIIYNDHHYNGFDLHMPYMVQNEAFLVYNELHSKGLLNQFCYDWLYQGEEPDPEASQNEE